MSKKREISVIPALYQSSYEDIALFNWVEGQKRIIPSITVEQSIGLWMEYYGGEWDVFSLRTTYFRMQKKYYEAAKIIQGDT